MLGVERRKDWEAPGTWRSWRSAPGRWVHLERAERWGLTSVSNIDNWFATYVVSRLRTAGNCCLSEFTISADVVESRLKEAHIAAALDSNVRGSLTAMGTSCRKSRENVEEPICPEVCGLAEKGLGSGLGDAARSECFCGRS